jgi:hypothetical protein
MRTYRAALWLWLGAAFVAAPAFSQPSITIESDVVRITGITPGGQVAWLGVSREEPDYYRTTIIRRDGVLVDTDRDGVASITLEHSAPASSVWVAIDIQTGQAAAIAADPRFDLPLREPLVEPADAGVGVVELTADRHEYLEILLVRPGVGAWRATAGDGGQSDADGIPDGRIRLAATAVIALEGSPALAGSVVSGDVIACVDGRTLEYVIDHLAPRT